MGIEINDDPVMYNGPSWTQLISYSTVLLLSVARDPTVELA
jgi:hypothetical protein